MTKKLAFRRLTVLLALGLLASACGGRDDEPDADTDDTVVDDTVVDDTVVDDTVVDEPVVDPCDITLEATEIGVSEDTIKVIVLADSDNPLAPGLFEDAREGAFAWAADVNRRGGLACRDVEIEFHDTMLNPVETVNGFLKACSDALALVGTTVLFGQDTDDLVSCVDIDGNPTGVPDLAYITTEISHQCSPVSFHMNRPGAECPYSGGVRQYTAATGAVQWLLEQNGGDLRGVFIVPDDLPSTTESAVPHITAHEQAGVIYETAGVGGLDPQSAYTPLVQALRAGNLNFVYNGSNDNTMALFLKEASDQGFDTSNVNWLCSLSCYSEHFLDFGGDAVEGTYVWMFFLPYEEADTNEELAAFMNAIDDDFPDAWAAGAWADGILFEAAVNSIVETDGPNAITRARLLEELRSIDSFNVNGWWGDADLTTTLTITDCFMVLQVQDGEFVRVYPEERGTMDCGDGNVAQVSADPAAFAPDI